MLLPTNHALHPRAQLRVEQASSCGEGAQGGLHTDTWREGRILLAAGGKEAQDF